MWVTFGTQFRNSPPSQPEAQTERGTVPAKLTVSRKYNGSEHRAIGTCRATRSLTTGMVLGPYRFPNRTLNSPWSGNEKGKKLMAGCGHWTWSSKTGDGNQTHWGEWEFVFGGGIFPAPVLFEKGSCQDLILTYMVPYLMHQHGGAPH